MDIPRDSDIIWQAAMNGSPIDRVVGATNTSDTPSYPSSTEPTYGLRNNNPDTTSPAEIAMMADYVDEVFRELMPGIEE